MSEFPRHGGNIERPLPHSIEAERSILGAVLLDNAALTTAVASVRPEDFFLPQHRRILEAMIALDLNGVDIDTVTLLEALTRSGNLEAAGGVAYLSQLADGLPRVTNVDHYARIVKDKASLRSAIYAAAAIQEQAQEGHESASALCAQATNTFEKLTVAHSVSWNETTHAPKDYQENIAMRFSIDGLIQDGGATMIGGLSGHGKTLIMLSIAKGLLSPAGTMLWGLFRVIEPAERILYLIPESTLGPFVHRLKLFRGLDISLYDHAVEHKRFFSRTLSKGPAIPLDDPWMLRAAKGTHIFLDTATRFSEGDENSSADNNNGLANGIFALLAAGARAVICAHHAPKAFARENAMMLENVLRGSGDVGAMLSTAFGVKQLDSHTNTIHVECVKARDFQACGPFQLQGRPYIDETGDFKMLKEPGDAGSLADEMPDNNRNQGGAAVDAREMRAYKTAMLRRVLTENPNASWMEVVAIFQAEGIEIARGTIRRYRAELGL